MGNPALEVFLINREQQHHFAVTFRHLTRQSPDCHECGGQRALRVARASSPHAISVNAGYRRVRDANMRDRVQVEIEQEPSSRVRPRGPGQRQGHI